MFLTWVLVLVAIWPFGRALWVAQTKDIDVNQQRAEVLAYQILQIYSESQKTHKAAPQSVRGLASVSEVDETHTSAPGADWSNWPTEGEAGRDPWGQPYKYKITRVSPEQPPVLEIWSQQMEKKFVLELSP